MKKHKLIQSYFDKRALYWFLDRAEVNNPYRVLEDFLLIDDLHGRRQELWNLAKVAIIGNHNTVNQTPRENLLFLYEQLLKLVEAIHVLHTNGEIKRNKNRLHKKCIRRKKLLIDSFQLS